MKKTSDTLKTPKRKVTTFLWFDDQAEQAAKFYVSLFARSKITQITRRNRKAFTVSFEIDGQAFIALNAGPHYKLTPACSMYVSCKDQKEVDRLWSRFSRGGKPMQCGWIEDRFGLTWQIVPDELHELIEDPRGMQAMLGMVKIDLAALRAAVSGARA